MHVRIDAYPAHSYQEDPGTNQRQAFFSYRPDTHVRWYAHLRKIYE